MPDWITHIVVAWTLCRILSFKFKEFNSANTMIVIAGALIPDLAKVVLGLKLIGVDAFEYLAPIHLPTGFCYCSRNNITFFSRKEKDLPFFRTWSFNPLQSRSNFRTCFGRNIPILPIQLVAMAA